MTLTIPAFDFTAFYYPEILEALFGFKRLNVPELTDESPQEPLVQMMRAFALVGHLNNVLLDQVANEHTLPTARLVETVRGMLRLIDYEMRPAVPSQTDVVFTLTQVLSSTKQVLPAPTRVETQSGNNVESRSFEVLEAFSVDATNVLTACFGVEDGAFTNRTTEANAGTAFAPWATPVGGSNLREGDSILFGHAQVMWDEADIKVPTPAAGIHGVWEYYDGITAKAAPASVVDNGATLTLNLNSYLGALDLRGTPIRIKLNSTGAYEDAFSYFAGGINRVDTVSLLGQSNPSTVADDYTVGSPWERFKKLGDKTILVTEALAQDGAVSFDLPQSLNENWSVGTINSIPAYWMRFRIITALTPTAPQIGRIRIDTGGQYVKQPAVQGRTAEETIGSGTGEKKQALPGGREFFISGSDTLTVDNVVWTRVPNFLASRPTDRHYRVQLTENERPIFVFGDGITGAVPPLGVNNIQATYRAGAELDGNVGADTITKDATGLVYVESLTNPRPAIGWKDAEGATPESLELVKVEGPASLHTRDVALGPDDVAELAVRASLIDSSVIGLSRAFVIEEGFGPKTMELVIVAAGGGQATQAQLDAISLFFNGDKLASPVKPKRVVGNQQVVAVNYTPRPINVTATVKDRGNVTSTRLANALRRLLQPEARQEDDGVTFLWEFGGVVPNSRLAHEIFAAAGPTTYDVDISVPAADTELAPRELPVYGALSFNVIK